MQKLINGLWLDCTEDDLSVGELYRVPVGEGGWQQQKYVAPNPASIQIIVTGITGDVSHSTDFTRSIMYENTNVVIAGTLAIPDQTFSLPVRRNDGRLFIFLAQVVSGAFSVTVNFATCGAFVYSDDECNIDLPYKMFTVNEMKIDVLRVIV